MLTKKTGLSKIIAAVAGTMLICALITILAMTLSRNGYSEEIEPALETATPTSLSPGDSQSTPRLKPGACEETYKS